MGHNQAKWTYRLLTFPVNSVCRVCGVASAVLILFMAVATSYEVIMRYAFHNPTKWVLESTELMLVAVVCLVIGYALMNNGHIRVDVLVSHLPARARTQLDRANYILGVLYAGVLSWAAFALTLNLYQRWAVSIVLSIPLYLIMLSVAIGAGLFALQYIIKLINSFNKAQR